MMDRMNHSQAAYLHRSAAWLIAGFAVLALLLGSVGLYGVISYTVGQHTREIGVRMAVGAQRSSVYRLIMTDACWLALLGMAGGVVGSVAAASILRTMLFCDQPLGSAHDALRDVGARCSSVGCDVRACSAVPHRSIPTRLCARSSGVAAVQVGSVPVQEVIEQLVKNNRGWFPVTLHCFGTSVSVSTIGSRT